MAISGNVTKRVWLCKYVYVCYYIRRYVCMDVHKILSFACMYVVCMNYIFTCKYSRGKR